MIGIYASVFLASLVGSLHCAGMCGPLAAFSGASRGAGPVLLREAVYHATRLASYVVLGVSGGVIGAGLDGVGGSMGLGRVAAIVAGGTMLAWGGSMLLGAAGKSLPIGLPASLRRPVSAMLQRLQQRPPLVRAALLGFGSALLPCGWLYAFVLVAAGTGGATTGALTMAAFWLGTVPALAIVSLSARTLARRLGRRLPVLGAAALFAVGLTTILTRAEMEVAPAPEATVGGVPTEAPCHGH